MLLAKTFNGLDKNPLGCGHFFRREFPGDWGYGGFPKLLSLLDLTLFGRLIKLSVKKIRNLFRHLSFRLIRPSFLFSEILDQVASFHIRDANAYEPQGPKGSRYPNKEVCLLGESYKPMGFHSREHYIPCLDFLKVIKML